MKEGANPTVGDLPAAEVALEALQHLAAGADLGLGGEHLRAAHGHDVVGARAAQAKVQAPVRGAPHRAPVDDRAAVRRELRVPAVAAQVAFEPADFVKPVSKE
jgi:hypothetical protein